MWSILVDDIPSEGLELRERDNPRSFGLEGDKFFSYADAIAVSLMIEKAGDSVKLKGEVSFKARLVCSRCLEPFLKEFSSLVDIVYQAEPIRAVEKESSLREKDMEGFYYGKDRIIELKDTIREFVLLSLPVKPLCMPDCLGLCPSCGKNLNQGPCSCQRQRLDPRFKKLKDYKR